MSNSERFQVTSVFARTGYDFFPTANNYLETYQLRAPAAK